MHRSIRRAGSRLAGFRPGLWLAVLIGGLSECLALWRARWHDPSDRAEA